MVLRNRLCFLIKNSFMSYAILLLILLIFFHRNQQIKSLEALNYSVASIALLRLIIAGIFLLIGSKTNPINSFFVSPALYTLALSQFFWWKRNRQSLYYSLIFATILVIGEALFLYLTAPAFYLMPGNGPIWFNRGSPIKAFLFELLMYSLLAIAIFIFAKKTQLNFD